MADLVAADVTYTSQGSGRITWGPGGRRHFRYKLAFGDGAKTYPAGGVPLDKTKLGLPTVVDALHIYDPDDGSGLWWKWDAETNKLRGYWPTGGGGTAPVAAATNPVLRAGAVAVTSSAATAPVDPGQAKEFVAATTTIPAQTLYVEAVGY